MKESNETKGFVTFFFFAFYSQRRKKKGEKPMPKTKFQNVVYTIIMALIMVYGMIVYNVALNTGGVTNATFGMALHELPIMMPIAAMLEFFIVEKLATKLAFTVVRPTDRP